jgi:hypothetical protein
MSICLPGDLVIGEDRTDLLIKPKSGLKESSSLILSPSIKTVVAPEDFAFAPTVNFTIAELSGVPDPRPLSYKLDSVNEFILLPMEELPGNLIS